MRTLARIVSGHRTAWAVLAATAVAVALLFAVLPASEGDAAPPSGVPDTSQSAQVTDLLSRFPSADTTVGILVFRHGGDRLDDLDLAAIDDRAGALAELSTTPQAVRPQVSEDGTAALVAVPLDAARADADVAATAASLRDAASADLPAGLDALLTGPVGFQDDIANAFAGADFRLLLVTVIVVAVLLIVTYRSPVLWIVPLAVVGTADALAGRVAAAVAEPLGISIDASISGILSVLVFGAGTNYALLLVARYREELLLQPDRHRAMRTAVTSAGPAIAASGGTVALSLLTLLLASLSGNRALGLACAVGVVVAIVFALVALPAALVVCGRGLFWPFVPRASASDAPDATAGGATHHAAPRRGFWDRLGRGVRRRPAVVAVSSVAGIAVLCLGLSGYAVGLSQTDQLLGEPDSVTAQKVIDESFSAGLTSRTTVLVPSPVADEATALASDTEGVDTATPGETEGGRTRIDLQLTAEPESDAAFATVERLRSGYADAGGPLADALVGGSDATAYDTKVAAQADVDLIAPIILAIVFAVLALLLRSLVAPVLLIASVLATFFASLGASTWLFQNVLGFPALDTAVTLYAFLFLVALGVDYNIFLTTRAREEGLVHGTREGMVRALASTGAVITSAGVLLAAVFAVLGVLPVVALTQVGVIVCLGVLLDTLVVRTVLVPALVFLTGDAFWWPSRRASGGRRGGVIGGQRQAPQSPAPARSADASAATNRSR
ncbi:MMPL family transporter [Frigoribacterium sp. VKM Ac-2836]|uniref:MMPL family transporter n=1 Tax=Frigoribacterium sp. VKM Ac-2836 TaxID=2739014 RepID=UPI0015672657|nr:MMPL family transporter [Frigoribacterium sp. VKM Ac-2836]NRD25208.1 MMPL family transporter [Frigoribacterium sp. VKM Ac-2836]